MPAWKSDSINRNTQDQTQYKDGIFVSLDSKNFSKWICKDSIPVFPISGPQWLKNVSFLQNEVVPYSFNANITLFLVDVGQTDT